MTRERLSSTVGWGHAKHRHYAARLAKHNAETWLSERWAQRSLSAMSGRADTPQPGRELLAERAAHRRCDFGQTTYGLRRGKRRHPLQKEEG